jgi:hypothetical protein
MIQFEGFITRLHRVPRPASRLVACIAVAVLLPALAACNRDITACPSIEHYAITVVILDSVTQAPTAEGAIGYVQDGDYLDSMVVTGTGGPPDGRTPVAMSAAFGRPGVYDVHVSKVGYRDWATHGVVVERARCHVGYRELTALLVPVL